MIVALESEDRSGGLELSSAGGESSWPLHPEATDLADRSRRRGAATIVVRLRHRERGAHARRTAGVPRRARAVHAVPISAAPPHSRFARDGSALPAVQRRARAQRRRPARRSRGTRTRQRKRCPRPQLRARARRRHEPAAQPALAGPAADRRRRTCAATTRRAEPGSRSAATGTTSFAARTGSCRSPSGTSPAEGFGRRFSWGRCATPSAPTPTTTARLRDILRRMSRHVTDDAMATALCMTFDPYHRELTYASAGAPAVAAASEASPCVTRLDQASAPPLGIGDGQVVHEDTVALPAGATVLTYTDGLIERRDWSLDVGIDLLASVLASSAASPSRRPGLPHRARRRGPGRLGRRHRVPDHPHWRVPARMDIEIAGRSRPHSRDCGGACAHGSSCAASTSTSARMRCSPISEACNNAIEHGYQRSVGNDTAGHRPLRGRARIMVEDHGTWRPPVAGPRTRQWHRDHAGDDGEGQPGARARAHTRAAQPAARALIGHGF